MQGKAHRDTANKLQGTSREDEEQYLLDTIAVADRNLLRAQNSVKALNEEMEELREQIESTGDKEGLFLWNNAKAQLKDSLSQITRYEKARKKPYFGRIDFCDGDSNTLESYYIGRVGIAKTPSQPMVIDWRAPVASVYYENAMGKGQYYVPGEGAFAIDLKRKRSYEIEEDRLKDFYDLDVVANDELLTKYLSKNKSEVLGEIIATIQKEQNQIIRRSPRMKLIVQGVAGSGKTTVAMHRISHILYNYEKEFRPEDFYIIGSNRILLNYITGVLPDLDVYGVRQMTMEQLFIRLLYEDWDDQKYAYHPLDRMDAFHSIKGSKKWFEDLQEFCVAYEKANIPNKPIYMEKTEKLLIGTNLIDTFLQDNPLMSMQGKRLMLNEILYSKYENEILGKHISFSPEEKKLLEKKYSTYFGKDGWKGSLYELYEEFLLGQVKKGYRITIPKNSYDVYDLAALAYLYKRIKEIDPVREASHVVIDEAQDFGMMAYYALHYCMRGCTYTIMGDTSQNIHFDYGLNDWEDLKSLILSGQKDKFCLLRKSYRNTVEISNFATEILRHGDFSIYPVEPIIRHGNDVTVRKVEDEIGLYGEAIKIIKEWQSQGYETIAVVCRDDEEALSVSEALKQYITIKSSNVDEAEFGNGVMVLSVVYTKGLEFDAVLVFNPTEDKYPADNGHVKMLYVTATRALHELAIIHCGGLTKLLAEKAPEGKHLEEFSYDSFDDEEKKPLLTRQEIVDIRREDGNKEMAARSYIGPSRITLKSDQYVKPEEKAFVISTVERPTKSRENVAVTAQKKKIDKKVAATGNRPMNDSPYSFGQMPEERNLMVKGHSKADLAVRWVKKNKTSVEVASRYGLLVLTPISEGCMRVRFCKGQVQAFAPSYWDQSPEAGLKWTAKESPNLLEVATKKITIRIEKRDGAIRFLTSDRKLLLSERLSDGRFINEDQCYNFFEFERKEKLKAKGILDTDLLDISMKAKYISFGGKQLRMPIIQSNKGYQLAIASQHTVMFCGISTYGQYIYTQGAPYIDYYFQY